MPGLRSRPTNTVAALLLALAVPGAAAAETLALAEGDYREAFAGLAPVSGRLLTGLSFAAAGTFETGSVRLGLGAARTSEFVCVRVQSQDGLYWSENVYRLPPQGEAAPGLEIKTGYARELARYGVGQIGIRALTGRDCAAAEGALVPALPATQVDFARLTFQLNASGRRPSARLFDGAGAEVAAAACAPAEDGAAVAFNYACEIALPAELADGAYRLEVTLRGMTGARTVERFDVLVRRNAVHGG
ncbi:hypothetical protein L2U69_16155 [Zavarzinia compransoris]|uniref:hypothetical protein n=1 Tax=Zavarzinia marina TaxID=2911065 RepID=UPI001F1CD671|nr:hypothetical protein [Zavarzinia marina]MCF4167182.1 hypothetical protein [Zavarzinia marina]